MQVGSRIGQLGNKVFTSSKDLFEHVAEAVQAELDSIEGHVRKPKGGKQSLTKRCKPLCFHVSTLRLHSTSHPGQLLFETYLRFEEGAFPCLSCCLHIQNLLERITCQMQCLRPLKMLNLLHASLRVNTGQICHLQVTVVFDRVFILQASQPGCSKVQ